MYQQSWLTEEVTTDWKSVNVLPSLKGGPEGGPWEPQVCQPGLGAVKVKSQITPSTILWHMQDNQGIRSSWHGFGKGRSCWTNLIFCDQVTCSADVVDAPSLEVFKTNLDEALSNLGQWKMSLPMAGGLELYYFKPLNGEMKTDDLDEQEKGSLTPPAPQWGSSNEPEALDPAAEWLREAPAAGLVAQACLAGVGAEILALQSLYREGKLRHENNCLTEQDGDENGGGLCLVFCKVTAKQQINTMQGKITSPVKSKRTALKSLGPVAAQVKGDPTCMQLWSPEHKKDSDLLEQAQKRNMQMVRGMEELSCEERLRELG
ncbi:hypothetical protein HGM15179_000572 [Zosterops borbonicus]|uniref:Uncharacterized protein n=1 Tax=Zosterops borbonicus TaxID=364589 RepID=A0A8K1GXC1_9PASS|nr:hypothetical protein HGM15179_000572 [Zosterops borbonicus]